MSTDMLLQSEGVIVEKTYPNLVVVIPAYNEARYIGSVVLQAREYTSTVIVVDDGSTDATREIARAAGAIVESHGDNRGKGAALETGFRLANEYDPDVVVTIDADGQHVVSDIPTVIKPILNDEADIVIGSRYLDDTSEVPQHRVLGHRVFNLMTRLASGVDSTDSQSGFRAFSPRALMAMSFHSRSFSVESEMQFMVREHDLRLVEVPITIHYHDKPKRPVWQHGLIVLNGLLQLVGQYRPLLFFGIPSFSIISLGVAMGSYVVYIFSRSQQLAMGYAMIAVLLIVIGVSGLFTGIILHSVRGMVLRALHLNEDAFDPREELR